MTPTILHVELSACQVCVPSYWCDQEIEEFVNKNMPTGIETQWRVAHTGDEVLNGTDGRVQCESCNTCMHVVLSC